MYTTARLNIIYNIPKTKKDLAPKMKYFLNGALDYENKRYIDYTIFWLANDT